MKINFVFLRKEKFKKIILGGYFLIFSFFILAWIFFILLKFNLTFEPTFYWLLFLGLILTNIFYKLKSSFYLWIGFIFFIVAVFLFFLTLKSVSEFIFRNAFLFFLYGTVLSLIEYKKDVSRKEKEEKGF